ncbi:anti-sigma factor family protein [Sodalis sp. RH21]|uniref:anti-sigma factor family protein n=1 Tax=unclassified Sodalis (in: enterobacteria) TaxID=2636512 RepID=UPI0039B69CC2
MTQQRLTPPLSDEILVAYLDNELSGEQRGQVEQLLSDDPDLAGRLAHLDRASLPFGAAFAGMLAQAPVARLQQRLDNLAAAAPVHSAPERGVSRRNLIAAAIACLAVGAVGGRLSLGLPGREASEGNWRDLVAQYMSLYTGETFADMPDAPEWQQRQLQNIGARLGLELNRRRVNLPGAELKYARLLSYDRQPIAQIAYLDAQGRPLAFCITQSHNGGSEAPGAQTEVRRGMNVVYWSAHGHDFMLIGHGARQEMLALAQPLMAV